MAESQTQKKNKKGKKKPESNTTPAVTPASNVANCSGTASINKQSLPEKLNIKTSQDMEITVIPNVKTEEVIESSSKKKKKSKKKSEEEVLKEEAVENENSKKSLLNFSENGIHLVNHPEISVTFTDSFQTKNKESLELKGKIPPTEEKPNENTAANSSKKKKKKKKKGNNNDNNLPDVPTSSSETTYSAPTPTYTKVVTPDNNCVLVVNNEHLSVSSILGNSDKKKEKNPENKMNFSISSEKQIGDVLFTNNFTPDNNIKLCNSVSIFPVLTNVNANTADQSTIVNSQQSVKNDSNTIKDVDGGTEEKENTDDSQPTKAQLKAERRAKQEAQRAAKLAKSTIKVDTNSQNAAENKNINISKEKPAPKESGPKSAESVPEKKSVKSTVEKDDLRKVRLFSHLPQCRQFDSNAKVHPAILEVGSQYSKGIICGSNARCIALLAALQEIISVYTPQPDKNFCRDLEGNIQTYLSYLNSCRPLSVSMVNAVKFLKYHINRIPSEMGDDKTREQLCSYINHFVKEEILLAKEAIGNIASEKIVDGDVILVYAHSSLVKDVLCKAHNENKKFRIVVADSRPKLEGLEMLRCLVKQGLHCSYISINAVSYVMKEVSKVIIGAHAILSNGSVMSRLGSKQIALVASAYTVPVFVCCETYKFCERVLTDSVVHNELGKPDDIAATTLVSNDSLKNWHDLSSLQLLNLLYDVIPRDLINIVVTEKGKLPCTSVPVVLRVRYAGLHEK